MKKLGLLTLLLVLSFGCDPEEEIMCDAGYTWEFVVKNGTGGKIIIISTDYEYGTGYPKLFAVAPNQSDPISAFRNLGPCDRDKPLMSVLDDEFYVNPMSSIIYGENQFFTMTIDGEVVADEIWQLKHWSFAPDYNDFYHATYTLTITDELLDSIMPKSE